MSGFSNMDSTDWTSMSELAILCHSIVVHGGLAETPISKSILCPHRITLGNGYSIRESNDRYLFADANRR